MTGIACIAWGSLVYDPRGLPCGDWRNDGPMLPVEFARESGGKKRSDPGDRITLVICPNVERVRTYWASLDVQDLWTARRRLAAREFDRADDTWTKKHIGYWDRASGESFGLEANTIGVWAEARSLSAVVWTHLEFGFKKSRGVMPEGPAIVQYLRDLDATRRPAAENYVRCAPAQVDTAYRRLIAQDLNWPPRDCRQKVDAPCGRSEGA